ncbi:hypothetical protein AgCh_018378 [Apium graveolens]
MVHNHDPDPVNFNVNIGLAGQVHELGFGQAEAPQLVVLDLEENEANINCVLALFLQQPHSSNAALGEWAQGQGKRAAQEDLQ